MKQEDKELLLKDLCARLPYGVNVEYTFKATVIATNTEEIITKPLYLYSINTLDDMTVSGIDNDGYENICFFEEIKPYLFPLSSITKEIMDEIYATTGVYDISIDSSIHIEVGTTFIDLTKISDILHKHHIDYRGLIPKGLAIDATGLNIY